MDEFNAAAAQRIQRLRRGEHLAFGIARCSQSGSDTCEIGVVVSGVADKLPCALRDTSDNGIEESLVERAGHQDTEGAIGGAHPGVLHFALEFRGEAAQDVYLGVSDPQFAASP